MVNYSAEKTPAWQTYLASIFRNIQRVQAAGKKPVENFSEKREGV